MDGSPCIRCIPGMTRKSEASMIPDLKHILLVEDEEDIRTIAKIALEGNGFILDLAESGQEGIEKALTHKPQFILLDVMMPGMDGLSTLRELRKFPQTAPIPVAFMTANAQSRQIDNYRRLGAIDVITKPFDPVTLAS